MSEYNLTLTIRNGLLLSKMRQAGMSTAAELSRATGVGQTDIGEYLRLLESPYRAQTGELKRSAEKLCDYFGCIIEELFPREHLYRPMTSNRYEADISADKLGILCGLREPIALEDLADSEDEQGQRFNVLFKIAELNPHEQAIINSRFVDELGLEQSGAKIGVSKERARQIEMKALRKLRKFGSVIHEKWRGEKYEL